MKKYSIVLLFLVACTEKIPETSEPIQGVEIDGQATAYTEMCEREPESVLCPQEVKDEH